MWHIALKSDCFKGRYFSWILLKSLNMLLRQNKIERHVLTF
uniref:Uncharacterized protein n=1 Tax=Arundo donax TaxID=35708 RepID=A0A0A9HPK5_ARUDO